MTAGQESALRELQRLAHAGFPCFELASDPRIAGSRLSIRIALRMGAIETTPEGLDLREREEFILWIPSDFPFTRPSVSVDHTRFAGFPHVIWTYWLCLYQSSIEWNPSDGLFGFFDRFRLWLAHAAVGNMDPAEGPLEPPHHVTDVEQVPFVVRADAPCQPGEAWMGFAVLQRYSTRIEIVAWHPLSSDEPLPGEFAFAVFAPKALPMEFPETGADLFRALGEAGIDESSAVSNLAIAALACPDGSPLHLVVGLPMRRSADGSPRQHIAVWTAPADRAQSLRNTIPKGTDTDELRSTRAELQVVLVEVIKATTVSWCRLLDDRPEIVQARDTGAPMAQFRGKRVLLLGCGALGAWSAELIVRARPAAIDLVDSSIVKPGILVRQNFTSDDIGAPKATRLARRLSSFGHSAQINAFEADAHSFIFEDVERTASYDIVVDCTASTVLQMKLERDWHRLNGRGPRFLSFILDAKAQECFYVSVPSRSTEGVWDAYLQAKLKLSRSAAGRRAMAPFYEKSAISRLFQPEPGCSDPTFSGSAADVLAITSLALNFSGEDQEQQGRAVASVFSIRRIGKQTNQRIALEERVLATAGTFSIRVHPRVFAEGKMWIAENARERSAKHETGGLLWGCWDDALRIVWIDDLTGPPPDSTHSPSRFDCGSIGTRKEHRRRMKHSFDTCGFIGYWHTHPKMISEQSGVDMLGMARLISAVGENLRRSLMLIFGRKRGTSTMGLYVYESEGINSVSEFVSVGSAQIRLSQPVF
jgi:hypothetical protein